jgi:hypothetical protein
MLNLGQMIDERTVEPERAKSPVEHQMKIFRQGLEGSGVRIVEEVDLGTLQKKGYILWGESGKVEVRGARLNTGAVIPFLQGEGGVPLRDVGVDSLERFNLSDGRKVEVWEGVETTVQKRLGPESVSHEIHLESRLTLNALRDYEVDRNFVDWDRKTMDSITLRFAPTDQRWRISVGQYLFEEERKALLSGKEGVVPPSPNLALHVTPEGEITTTFLTRYVPIEEEDTEGKFQERVSVVAWQHNKQGLTARIVSGEDDDRAQEAEGTEPEIDLHREELRRLVFRGGAEGNQIDIIATLRACDDLTHRAQIQTKKRVAST